MAYNCEMDLTIHGNLKRSFCQNVSSLDLNVLSVGLSTTSVGNEFQSLTTRWLNTFGLTPSREKGLHHLYPSIEVIFIMRETEINHSK